MLTFMRTFMNIFTNTFMYSFMTEFIPLYMLKYMGIKAVPFYGLTAAIGRSIQGDGQFPALKTRMRLYPLEPLSISLLTALF